MEKSQNEISSPAGSQRSMGNEERDIQWTSHHAEHSKISSFIAKSSLCFSSNDQG